MSLYYEISKAMKEKLMIATRRLFRFEKSVELRGLDTTTSDPTTTTTTTATSSEVTILQMNIIKRKEQSKKSSKWID